MIYTQTQLADIPGRHPGQTIVLASGTFDLLHVGHLAFLSAARRYGDILVVMLSGDARVRYRKGPQRPIIPEAERAALLDGLKIVDYVFIDPNHNEPGQVHPSYAQILDDLKPDVYVTDGPDIRFSELPAPDMKTVIIDRCEAGQYGSTSGIIQHIQQLL